MAHDARRAKTVAAARDDRRPSFVLEADGAADRVSNNIRRDDALPNFNVPIAAVGEVSIAKQQQRAAGGGSVVLDLGRARLERRRRGFWRA